jgi:hypothetical protein
MKSAIDIKKEIIRDLVEDHRRWNRKRLIHYERRSKADAKLLDFQQTNADLYGTKIVFSNKTTPFTPEQRKELDRARELRSYFSKKISKLAEDIGLRIYWGDNGQIRGFWAKNPKDRYDGHHKILWLKPRQQYRVIDGVMTEYTCEVF